MKSVLLVDYENVQQVDLASLLDRDTDVTVFVGHSQARLPFELVADAQRLGERLRWIRISGNGKNALDFHIAYEIGRLSAIGEYDDFIILSRDTGFDPLVTHVAQSPAACRRINSLVELGGQKPRVKPDKQILAKALDNLRKVDPKKRPQKRQTLLKHLSTAVKGASEDKLVLVVDHLFIQRMVSEDGGRLRYHLQE